MSKRYFIILGSVFLIAGGCLYTLERVGNWIAIGLSAQGLAINSGNGSIVDPHVGFFDNVFVLIFCITGVILITLGIYSKSLKIN